MQIYWQKIYRKKLMKHAEGKVIAAADKPTNCPESGRQFFETGNLALP
jgi:predicted alternative tryptophan synthase beta-subunit